MCHKFEKIDRSYQSFRVWSVVQYYTKFLKYGPVVPMAKFPCMVVF